MNQSVKFCLIFIILLGQYLPTIDQYLVNSWPMLGQHLANTWPILGQCLANSRDLGMNSLSFLLKKRKYCNPFLPFLFTFLCIFKNKTIKNCGKIINICVFGLKMWYFISLLSFFRTFFLVLSQCSSWPN